MKHLNQTFAEMSIKHRPLFLSARPHLSLRVALEVPGEFNGCVKQKYRPMTPAMAAGVTDHIWFFRELLTAKVGTVP